MSKHLITRAPLDISEKVTASTAAVAITTVGIWIVEATANIDVPSFVEVAVATVAVFAAGYLKRDKEIS